MICPICGDHCQVQNNNISWLSDDGNPYPNITFVQCNNTRIEFLFNESITNCDPSEQRRRFSMISYIVLNEPIYRNIDKKHSFTYSNDATTVCYPVIDLSTRMNDYPQNPYEKTLMAFRNLSKIYNDLHFDFSKAPMLQIPMFCRLFNGEADQEISGMFNLLLETGFIMSHSSTLYRITLKGWDYVRHIQMELLNQGFIAMSFAPEANKISVLLQQIITDCKYSPLIISNKEHNNQIVPEIFFEIRRSKFVVVDITYPNNGAYYEAGYAEAVGKQVIVCCRKSEFENSKTKPHFDIAQKAAVLWETEDELRDKLYKRIVATVGLNNLCVEIIKN